MQDAVGVGEGAMAAIIGLDEATVEEICSSVLGEGVCQIANDNGGGQLVISGETNAINAACKIASEKGAKRAIILPVSAPFHSSLMQPAADAMKEALLDVNKNAPLVPLIPNVTVEPESDPQHIIELLVHQVTGRVRWRETIEWFAQNGVDTLFEIGSGKVLTGLARRINKDINGLTVGSSEEIETALKALGI